jgi:hypothetical protein
MRPAGFLLPIGVPMAPTDDEEALSPWLRTPSRKPKQVAISAPIPRRVAAVLSQRLFIEKAGLPSPLLIRETNFELPTKSTDISIQELYSLLVNDKTRNEQVINDVLLVMEEGRSPILLTERKDHLEFFHERLKGFVTN